MRRGATNCFLLPRHILARRNAWSRAKQRAVIYAGRETDVQSVASRFTRPLGQGVIGDENVADFSPPVQDCPDAPRSMFAHILGLWDQDDAGSDPASDSCRFLVSFRRPRSYCTA